MVLDHHCQHSGALRVPVDAEARIGGNYVLTLYSDFCTSLQYHFSYNTCKTPAPPKEIQQADFKRVWCKSVSTQVSVTA